MGEHPLDGPERVLPCATQSAVTRGTNDRLPPLSLHRLHRTGICRTINVEWREHAEWESCHHAVVTSIRKRVGEPHRYSSTPQALQENLRQIPGQRPARGVGNDLQVLVNLCRAPDARHRPISRLPTSPPPSNLPNPQNVSQYSKHSESRPSWITAKTPISGDGSVTRRCGVKRHVVLRPPRRSRPHDGRKPAHARSCAEEENMVPTVSP